MTPPVTLPADPAKPTREQIVDALRRQPKTLATLADAAGAVSYTQAEAAGNFGDRPLIVLTRGKVSLPPNPSAMDREGAAYARVWMHEIQPKLARLSSRGRQIIVPNSGHGIPDEAPEAVISAIREVLGFLRSRTLASAQAAHTLRPKRTETHSS